MLVGRPIVVEKLCKMPRTSKLIEILDQKSYDYELTEKGIIITRANRTVHFYIDELPVNTVFQNFGTVIIGHLKALPVGTFFNNIGMVELADVTKLPSPTIFNNKSYNMLQTFDFEGVKFCNNGMVSLPKLSVLPKKTVFRNSKHVYLNS